MAGGEHAQFFPCLVCGKKAERTREGVESDAYECVDGHVFTIDWSRSGPPAEPMWPPKEADGG